MSDIFSIQEYAVLLGENARKASQAIRTISTETRNSVLNTVAKSLRVKKAEILEANARDLKASENNLSPAMMDRLTLNDARIESIAKGVEEIAAFADPLGRVLESRTLANGIEISRVAVPIGSVFFI